MKNDFQVNIARAGDNEIALTLFGKNFPPAGQRLASPRAVPQLDAALIDELRQGDPDLASVQDATNKVSQWLLGNDLYPYLNAAMQAPGGEPLRLIFNLDSELRSDARLGDVLADLPLELLMLPGDIVPLVLSAKVAAFIHLLDKVPYAQTSTTQRNPPLRILMVHSNPIDLGGKVPDPVPIRREILQLGQHLGPKFVEVDVLSRKRGEGWKGYPTPDGLWKQLRDVPLPYDILVYLGHGNRAQYRADLLPLGLLYLESSSGNESAPVTADRLAQELHNNPVSAVLLIGCLTAAELPDDQKEVILKRMPMSMRGNQGVAQALVNSSSGVQLAIGMRSKLETDDAKKFLIAFFESLLQKKPGNMEAAVHAGRESLHAAGRSGWSAPIMFRVVREEPMFDFLASPPAVVIDEGYQKPRTIFWEMLKKQSLSKTTPDRFTELTDVVKDLDTNLVNKMVEKAPLLMPEWQLGQQGQTVTLPINLHGSLNAERLEGDMIVDGEGVSIERVAGAPSLSADYLVLHAITGNKAHFQITRAHPGPEPLPTGPLMHATFKLGPATGITYPVTLSELKPQPLRTICPGNSVIIVPAP